MRTYRSLKQMTLFQFRTMMRNKIAFFFNLAMPLILVVVFGSMYGGKDGRFNVFEFMMPGQLTYMLLNAGIITVAISVAYQRSSGSMRHLFSTPVSVGVWVTSRILASLLLACVQIAALFAVAMAIFQVQAPVNLVGTAVVLVVATLCGLGFGLAIGATTRNPEAAQPIAMILGMGLAFLGGSMFPLEESSALITNLATLTPSYYMTQSLRLVMMQGQGLGAVLGHLLIMGSCAAAGIALAAWRIRRQFIISE